MSCILRLAELSFSLQAGKYNFTVGSLYRVNISIKICPPSFLPYCLMHYTQCTHKFHDSGSYILYQRKPKKKNWTIETSDKKPSYEIKR